MEGEDLRMDFGKIKRSEDSSDGKFSISTGFKIERCGWRRRWKTECVTARGRKTRPKPKCPVNSGEKWG